MRNTAAEILSGAQAVLGRATGGPRTGLFSRARTDLEPRTHRLTT